MHHVQDLMGKGTIVIWRGHLGPYSNAWMHRHEANNGTIPYLTVPDPFRLQQMRTAWERLRCIVSQTPGLVADCRWPHVRRARAKWAGARGLSLFRPAVPIEVRNDSTSKRMNKLRSKLLPVNPES
jgi:hypothetical protein